MTREIKFRGKSIHTDKWHYGDLFRPNENTSFIYEKGTAGILCSHIGQFTGLLDKNGKEIYEGDIIKTKRYGVVHGQSNTQGADLFRVVYKNAQFYIDNKLRHFYLQDSRCNEVIGNIYDNPELLKTEAL